MPSYASDWSIQRVKRFLLERGNHLGAETTSPRGLVDDDDAAGLGLYVSVHLCLPFSFRQEGQNSGDLSLRILEPRGVLCLPRRQSKADAHEVVLRILQPQSQGVRVQLAQLACLLG